MSIKFSFWLRQELKESQSLHIFKGSSRGLLGVFKESSCCGLFKWSLNKWSSSSLHQYYGEHYKSIVFVVIPYQSEHKILCLVISEAVDTRLPVTGLVRVASGPDRGKSKHARNDQ